MKKLLKRLLLLCVLVCLGVTSAIVHLKMTVVMADLPSIETMRDYRPAGITTVYDRNGELMARFSKERRTVLTLEKIPKRLINAFIAAEDAHFWTHRGIDWFALARCGVKTAIAKIAGGSRCGGSTITQQTVQLHLLSMKHSEVNKIKKLLLASAMEDQFSKDEILFLYLNQIYFGNGAYGVEEAAQTYFGKHVHELTLAECATLATIPKHPNEINPFKNQKRTLERRAYVLGQLKRHGLATDEEIEEATQETIERRERDAKPTNSPYAAEEIRRYLIGKYGEDAVYHDGLIVHSTIDMRGDLAAEKAMRAGLIAVDKRNGGTGDPPQVQGALVAIDPETRQVRAMIGGYSFDAEKSSFNRATQAQRQPGSSFKPFIYAEAIASKEYTAATMIFDSPKLFRDVGGQDWEPQNSDGKFRGDISLRECLTFSVNICSVTLVESLTPAKVVEAAKRVGLGGKWSKSLSLALGTGEVTTLKLANAYATLADKGRYAEPILVRSVQRLDGRVLERNEVKKQAVMDPAVAYVTLSMMKSVIETGTAQIIKALKRPVAGKTGTTGEAREAWFAGCVPTLCTAVYVGLDNHEPLGKDEYGGKASAPIWLEYNKAALKDVPVTDFPMPEGVEVKEIDMKSGLLPYPDEDEEQTITEVFLTGTAPTEIATASQPGEE